MMEATGQILPSFFFFPWREVPSNTWFSAMEADAHTWQPLGDIILIQLGIYVK